ncbi:MAG TPA: ABC transporter ATP-binding protein, partial [Bacteroidales bacterium]|nr:ABC transporter ATP-binding protein [Bacteroidales bacterium]
MESTANNRVIHVRELVKKFGDFVANDHLNFDVYAGEIFGFLGANGAGKTTAMKILCGLQRPSSGTIEVAGFDVYKQSDQIKKNIGYMSQKFSLYEDLTVKENFQFYGGIYGLSAKEIKDRTRQMLESLQMSASANMILRDIPL